MALGGRWGGKPRCCGGTPGVRLRWWHHGGGTPTLGSPEKQRDSVDCSRRAWQAQRNCFGARAFLSSLANQLYEKMSHLQPGWHGARCRAVEPGGLCVQFWGVSFPCSIDAHPPALSRSRSSVCSHGTAQVGAGRSCGTKIFWSRLAHPKHGSLGMAGLGTDVRYRHLNG